MLNYNEYKKISAYLDKNEIDKLKCYLSKLYEDSYLKTTGQVIKKYLNTYCPVCGYVEDKKVLISDSCSAYILNSDKVLSDYRRKKILVGEVDPKLNVVYETFIKFENTKQIEVGKIDKIENQVKYGNKTIYEISSIDNSVSHRFDIRIFDIAKAILGEEIRYKLCTDYVACMAYSDRGKGLVLGLK